MVGKGIDLSGVDPARRAEIRRRVEVVRAYLEISAPSLADDRRHAGALGLGVAQFMNLVRIWREHRQASALPGARIRRDRGRWTPVIGEDVEAIVRAVIDQLGADANPTAIQREVEARCGGAGLRPPSIDTTRARVLAARGDGVSETAAIHSAVLDHVALGIPVAGPQGRTGVPVLSFVANQGSGYVIGHAVSLHPPSPQGAARALLSSLDGSKEVEVEWPLSMAVDATPGWRSLLDVLSRHGVIRTGRSGAPVPCGVAAKTLFGSALGGIPIRQRLVHAPSNASPGKLRGGRRPLSLEQARDAIAAAIDAHNAGRDARPFALTSRDRGTGLVEELTRLAASPDEPPRRR